MKDVRNMVLRFYCNPVLLLMISVFFISACEDQDLITDGDYDVEDTENVDGDDDQSVDGDDDQSVDGDDEQSVDGDDEQSVDGDDEQVACDGCLIEGTCVADGTGSDDLPCAVCDAGNNNTGWSPRATTVECRAAAGECDLADMCDGENLACPEDAFVAATTNCGDAATECSGQDTCDGAGVCQPNHFATSITCGDAGSECVNQDYCDGAGACQDNGFVAADTNCGDAATECSAQDTCDGAGVCQPNHLAADTNCGDTASECSGQDTCDGSGVCQPNHLADTTTCGDAGSECVNQDYCDGAGACHDNGFVAADTTCGDAASECSGQDTCDGSGVCQPNHLADTTTCGDAGSECVNQDYCDGAGACHDNGFVAADTNCGDAASECSGQDTCNGAGVCQPNHLAADTNCGDAASECSGQDTCDGSGVCQPNHLADTTTCGDAGSECVNQDYCDGAGACHDNGFVAADTTCGDAGSECSGQDTCDGSGVCQPNHIDNGTTCGTSDQCVDGVCEDCYDNNGCGDLGWDGRDSICSERICNTNNNCVFNDATVGTACSLSKGVIQDDDQCVNGACVDCYDTSGCNDYTQDDNPCTVLACTGNSCTDANDDNQTCDLGKDCTTDHCVSGECQVETITSGCLINNSCVAEGTSQDADGCVACSPNISKIAWTDMDGAICAVTDDGNPCTDDVCSGGTCTTVNDNNNTCSDANWCTAFVCSDGNCIFDSIEDTGCFIANACYAADALKGDSGNDSCYVCDTDYSHEDWTKVADTTSCNDGNACTFTDQCNDGTCAGTTYTCTNGSCNGDGTCTCDENYQDNDEDNVCNIACSHESAPSCGIDSFICSDRSGEVSCKCSGVYTEYFHDDFETGVFDDWSNNGSSLEIVSPGADTSSYALQITSNTTADNDGISVNISVDAPEKLSYYVKFNGAYQYNGIMKLTTASGEILSLQSERDNSIMLNDNATFEILPLSDAWVLFEYVFDWDNFTVDIYMDGETLASDFNLLFADSTITGIAFSSYTSGDSMIVDDVRFFNCGQGADLMGLGWKYSCVAKGDTEIKCWGSNDRGQLGNGTNNISYTAVSVSNVNPNFKQLIGAEHHACVLNSDSTVECWGGNNYGQLGDGTFVDKNVPTLVTDLGANVTALGTGFYTSCAILEDSTVKCWGRNSDGELGDGTTTNSNVPIVVTGLNSVVAIQGGYAHMCALLADGTVKCWGDGDLGQIGDDYSTSSTTPIQVLGIGAGSGVTSINCGGYHTCALFNDQSVKCWGSNNYGQVGNGTNWNCYSPTQVSGLGADSGVRKIVMGSSHTCALFDDQSVKCWGYNGWGQLGTGNNTNVNIPVQVSGLGAGSGVIDIEARVLHTCALFDDQSVKCWGYNAYGQIGNATATSSFVPVTVQNF